MGLFTRKKKRVPTRFDAIKFDNPTSYEVKEALEECFQEVEKLGSLIPSFKAGEVEYLEVMKVVPNTGKSQPYKDKVSIDTGNDVYHIWFYPTGEVWKAELNCWATDTNGYFAKLKRNERGAALLVDEMGIKFPK